MSIKINTNDEKYITINDIKPYQNILLLKSLLNSNNEDDDEDDNNEMNLGIMDDYEIDLDVKYNILKKIMDYSLHCYETKDLNITDQDRFNYENNYLDCSYETLCEILNSADYLQYDNLVELICEKFSNDIIKYDDLDTLKKNFNITDCITKEEEEELLNKINT